MNTKFDVIVVGAGAAGILSARTLQRAGKSVVVLEAQDYVGGRTKTYEHEGVLAEEGAEFVHGEHAVTWDHIRKAGLHSEEWQYDSQSNSRHFGKDGRLRDDGNSLLLEMRQAEAGIYEYTGDEQSVADFINAHSVSDEAKFYARRHIGDIEAADAEKIGLAGYVSASGKATNGSKNFWITEGYGQLIKSLSQDIDIRLDTPVTEIVWDRNAVKVYTKNEQMFEAKKLIFTVPIGVLHRRAITFSPDLPASFYEAADRIGFGNSTKATFWVKGDIPAFRMLDTAGAVGHFWQRRFGRQIVVVGFSGGSRADELAAMGGEQAIQVALDDLRTALGEDIGQHITHARHFSWSNNPFVGGSYSYPTLAMGPARSEIKAAIAGTIFYAGEATHDQGHAATVHGAMEEGVRAADEVLKAFSA